MDRKKAIKMSQALDDLGVSHAVECGIHENMAPSHHYAVRIFARPGAFDVDDIVKLDEVGKEYGLRLKVNGLRNDIIYFEEKEK